MLTATMERELVASPKDRYVIERYLAEGGMGAVFLGRKQGVGGFEKQVVLKQLLPEFTKREEFIELFLREARVSASLDHANIVHTIDLLQSGDTYYIVMEYVRGADLQTLLRRARKRDELFKPGFAVSVARSLLDALTYASNKTGDDGRPLRLIHRDISPSNVLVSESGEMKLTDFGIAKVATHHSVFQRVKGKFGYMSPEQAMGQPIDQRSDLFAVGVVLYEALVGERLFLAEMTSSPAEIFAQTILPPSARRPGLPPPLDEVVLRALQLDRNDRFQSAEEFQNALSDVTRRFGVFAGPSDVSQDLRRVCGDPSTWLNPDEDAPRPMGTARVTASPSSALPEPVSLKSVFQPGTEVQMAPLAFFEHALSMQDDGHQALAKPSILPWIGIALVVVLGVVLGLTLSGPGLAVPAASPGAATGTK